MDKRAIQEMFDDDRLPSLVRQRLAESGLQIPSEPYPLGFFTRPAKDAAVLLPLKREYDGWHLLLIRRACNEHDRHSGEVALPGGRVDPDDPDVETAALREAEEEIGLPRSNVRLLGRLEPYRSVSNFRISPIVGQVSGPFVPKLDPLEVDRLFSIPIAWLADPSNLQRRQRRLADSEVPIEVLYYRPYDGELLWGVTARLVAAFIDRLKTPG